MGACASAKIKSLSEMTGAFDITLTREYDEEELGLTLGRSHVGVSVYSISASGLVAQWNYENPQKDLQRRDHILKINGLEVEDSPEGWLMIRREMSVSKVVLTVVSCDGPRRRREHVSVLPPRKINRREVIDSLARAAPEECQGKECAICLEALSQEDDAVVLHCKHAFHRACLEPWLLRGAKNLRCPNCRCDVVGDEAAGRNAVNNKPGPRIDEI